MDHTRGNRELAAQAPQAERLNDLGYNVGPNYTSTATVENAGPVSATLLVSVHGADVPLDHTSRVTLYAHSPRVDIRNDLAAGFAGRAGRAGAGQRLCGHG